LLGAFAVAVCHELNEGGNGARIELLVAEHSFDNVR
jgi:hypothetical protein